MVFDSIRRATPLAAVPLALMLLMSDAALEPVPAPSQSVDASRARVFLPLAGVFDETDLHEAAHAHPDDRGWQHIEGFEDVSDLALSPVDGQPWLATRSGFWISDNESSWVHWRDSSGHWHRQRPLVMRPDVVQQIEVDARGRFWAAIDDRIWMTSADGLRRRRFDAADGLAVGEIVRLHSGPTGLWAASSDKLAFLAIDGDRWRQVPIPSENPFIHAVHEDPRQGVWLSGWFGDALVLHLRLDGTSDAWGTEAGLPEQGIGPLAVSTSGEVWAAGGDALLRLEEDSKWRPVAPSPEARNGWLHDLFFDTDGTAWYGDGDESVYRHRPDGTVHRFELPGTSPRALASDGADGLWVGSGVTGAPLGHVSADGRFRLFDVGDAYLEPGDHGCADLAIDHEDRPTCASDGDTLLRLDHDERLRAWVAHDELHRPPLHIGFDDSGRAWVGTGAGLSIRQGDGWWNVNTAEGLPGPLGKIEDWTGSGPGGPIIWTMSWTDEGMLLGYDRRVAGPGPRWEPGLARVSREGAVRDLGTLPLAEYQNIGAILRSAFGETWVVGKGIFDQETPWDALVSSLWYRADDAAAWQPVELPDDPAAIELHDAALAPDGSLWFASSAGLVQREPGGRWRHLPEAEGTILGDLRSIAVMDDGRVWFGGRQLGMRDPSGRWELVPRPSPWPTSGASGPARVLDIEIAIDGSVWCLVEGFELLVRLRP